MDASSSLLIGIFIVATLPIRVVRTLLMAGSVLLSPVAYALDISGASTIQPVAAQLIPLFKARNSEPARLEAGGSSVGIKDALSGKSQIGMVSRELTDDEKKLLKNTVIGIDALAIIVNSSNPVSNLTKAQLLDIYTGKISNWNALGGSSRPVVRVSKEVGRSTLELFEHYTGLLSADRLRTDKPLISKDAHIIGSNMEALTLVGGMRGAIGYVSVGTAHAMEKAGMPIKIVKLDGIEPTLDTIKTKRYPVIRPLNLVFLKETPVVTEFLSVALSAPGQDVVKSLGFLAVEQ